MMAATAAAAPGAAAAAAHLPQQVVGSKQAAAAAAAAGTSGVKPFAELTRPLLETWLLLMQQELLQQPDGLLLQAAASQQQLSQEQLQSVLSTACSCFTSAGRQHDAARHLYRPSSPCSSSQRCVTLNCDSLYAVSSLVGMMTRLPRVCGPGSDEEGFPDVLAVWLDSIVSVLLVLEVVVRHLLPVHVVLCGTARPGSSSSNSNSGSSNNNVMAVMAAAAAATSATAVSLLLPMPPPTCAPASQQPWLSKWTDTC